MLFAIVDIETTGSYAAGSGITDICIVIHDGREVLSSWQSLVNPHRPIPRFIQHLTGITPDMVANAPSFSELAPTVHEMLKDKVFVAHNVNFDYSFVKHHLALSGYELHGRKLCTVRLARKVIPGHKSYSLGRICHALNIEHTDQHRAAGDAEATARLFTMICEQDTEGYMPAMLKGRNREAYLPPNVPVEQLDGLPQTPGVYYFYNAAGKVIYIGKAVNLQQRVKSHFANNKPGRQKADFLRETYRISYKETGTDLMAHILESVEIRALWPVHNRSQRGYHPKFGLYIYEDQQGFKRIALDKVKPNYKSVHTFNTQTEGHRWLRQLTEEFTLCARLCNLAKDADCTAGRPAETCSGGACHAHGDVSVYNGRVEEAIGWMSRSLPTLCIIDGGRNEEERSCVLLEKGAFSAMGYLGFDTDILDLAALRQQLEPYPDNDYIRTLVYKEVREQPSKVFYWDAAGDEPAWRPAGRDVLMDLAGNAFA